MTRSVRFSIQVAAESNSCNSFDVLLRLVCFIMGIDLGHLYRQDFMFIIVHVFEKHDRYSSVISISSC